MTSKKLLIILLVIIVIAYFALIVISLTNILPNNPFIPYRTVIVIGGFLLVHYVRKAYRKLTSESVTRNKINNTTI